MTFYDLLYHTKLIVSRKSGHKCCRSITGDLWGSVGNMLPSCWYYKPYWHVLILHAHRPHTVRGDGDCRRKIVLINSLMAPQGAVINVARLFTCRPSQTEAEVCITSGIKNSITWPSRWRRLEIKFKGEASSYTWNLANKYQTQFMRMSVTGHSDCSHSVVLLPPSYLITYWDAPWELMRL